VQKAKDSLKKLAKEQGIVITSHVKKQALAIEAVRSAREEGKQHLGFNSRPFILCGLPIKRPKKGVLLHIRKNGAFFLRVAGDPQFGLPFGQDRLIPLWIATLAVKQKTNGLVPRTITFNSAAEMLDSLGLPKDGYTYRRLTEGFKRVFASTIFFGTEQQLKDAAVFDWTRFHFFDRVRVWFSPGLDQNTLPDDDFRNMVVLSEEFRQELQDHPIPINLDVVKALANAPGKLDFYMWLSWRCFKAKGNESIPLFGSGGLLQQLGVEGYGRKRNFTKTVRTWLESIRLYWPECPASVSKDGDYLELHHAREITGCGKD
jgi:hypothetical protein